MRVFMLGWEFPPYISGGLGTACDGLTRALSQLGAQVTFVLPKPIGPHQAGPVMLQSPASLLPGGKPRSVADAESLHATSPGSSQPGQAPSPDITELIGSDPDAHAVRMLQFQAQTPGWSSYARPDSAAHALARLELNLSNIPGWTGQDHDGDAPAQGPQVAGRSRPDAAHLPMGVLQAERARQAASAGDASAGEAGENTQGAAAGVPGPFAGDGGDEDALAPPPLGHVTPADALYAGDLMLATRQYAAMCLQLAARQQIDVIHAHDWLTFPAAMALKAALGKPMIVHVHATEFDRAGANINHRIYEIERRGLHAADRVIAVSHLTRSTLQHRYGLPSDRVAVVYNGVERAEQADSTPRVRIRRGDKIVLYLGRITMQKGPSYFLHAAKLVLEKYEQVKFVMAGSGDLIGPAMAQAREQGIDDKVLFTGFLSGKDVQRVYQLADVYVMPSVSEPFGIAPLEAVRHDVPVIISKQSGVSEVLRHALKVDFWNVHDIADKILAVLRHPPLSSTLRQQADIEVRSLTWQDAARKCMDVYEKLISS